MLIGFASNTLGVLVLANTSTGIFKEIPYISECALNDMFMQSHAKNPDENSTKRLISNICSSLSNILIQYQLLPSSGTVFPS